MEGCARARERKRACTRERESEHARERERESMRARGRERACAREGEREDQNARLRLRLTKKKTHKVGLAHSEDRVKKKCCLYRMCSLKKWA